MTKIRKTKKRTYVRKAFACVEDAIGYAYLYDLEKRGKG